MVFKNVLVVSFPNFHFNHEMVWERDSSKLQASVCVCVCALTHIGFERVVAMSSDANGTRRQVILGGEESNQLPWIPPIVNSGSSSSNSYVASPSSLDGTS